MRFSYQSPTRWAGAPWACARGVARFLGTKSRSEKAKIMTIGEITPPVRILMGPGPSDIHPRVLQAMVGEYTSKLVPRNGRLGDRLSSEVPYCTFQE